MALAMRSTFPGIADARQKVGRSWRPLEDYIRFFRHPGHQHFSSFFQRHFQSMLARFWCQLGANIGPKSIKNRSRERSGKHQTFSKFFNGILMDFRFVATSFWGFPFEREAKLQDFDCLLSSCLFIDFRLHFWINSWVNFHLNPFKMMLKTA